MNDKLKIAISKENFADIAEAVYDANQLIDYLDESIDEYYTHGENICIDKDLTSAVMDELELGDSLKMIFCGESVQQSGINGNDIVSIVDQCVNAISEGFSVKTYNDTDTLITVIYGIKL